MTEQEAIEIIKKNYPKRCKMVNGNLKGGFIDTDCELGQAFNRSINALEEIQKYRAIGTVEECRAAAEKQTAKTCYVSGDGCADGHIIYDTYECSSCGKEYEIEYEEYEYCPNCGQHMKLERSEEE